MVKIKKGNLTAIVPLRVYKSIYEKQGWQIRVNKNVSAVNNAINKKAINTETITETDIPDEVDLESMNANELKEYAAKCGIDVSKANSKRELRAIIEATLDV